MARNPQLRGHTRSPSVLARRDRQFSGARSTATPGPSLVRELLRARAGTTKPACTIPPPTLRRTPVSSAQKSRSTPNTAVPPPNQRNQDQSSNTNATTGPRQSYNGQGSSETRRATSLSPDNPVTSVEQDIDTASPSPDRGRTRTKYNNTNASSVGRGDSDDEMDDEDVFDNIRLTKEHAFVRDGARKEMHDKVNSVRRRDPSNEQLVVRVPERDIPGWIKPSKEWLRALLPWKGGEKGVETKISEGSMAQEVNSAATLSLGEAVENSSSASLPSQRIPSSASFQSSSSSHGISSLTSYQPSSSSASSSSIRRPSRSLATLRNARSKYRLTFGKFNGRYFDDLPKDYKLWLLESRRKFPRIRQLQAELDRFRDDILRESTPPPVTRPSSTPLSLPSLAPLAVAPPSPPSPAPPTRPPTRRSTSSSSSSSSSNSSPPLKVFAEAPTPSHNFSNEMPRLFVATRQDNSLLSQAMVSQYREFHQKTSRQQMLAVDWNLQAFARSVDENLDKKFDSLQSGIQAILESLNQQRVVDDGPIHTTQDQIERLEREGGLDQTAVEQLERLDQQHDALVADNGPIHAMQDRIEQIDGRVVSLSEQIQNGQTAVKQLDQQCEAQQERVENLKQQVQQGYDAVLGQQGAVPNLEAGIAGLAQFVQADHNVLVQRSDELQKLLGVDGRLPNLEHNVRELHQTVKEHHHETTSTNPFCTTQNQNPTPQPSSDRFAGTRQRLAAVAATNAGLEAQLAVPSAQSQAGFSAYDIHTETQAQRRNRHLAQLRVQNNLEANSRLEAQAYTAEISELEAATSVLKQQLSHPLMPGSDLLRLRATLERLTLELAASQLALEQDNGTHAEYKKQKRDLEKQLYTMQFARDQPGHYREDEGKERDLHARLEQLRLQHEKYQLNMEVRLGTQTLPIRTRGLGSDITNTIIPPAPGTTGIEEGSELNSLAAQHETAVRNLNVLHTQRNNLQLLNTALSSNNTTQTRELERLNDGTAMIGDLFFHYRDQVQVEPQLGGPILEQIVLALGNMQGGRAWDEAEVERHMIPDSVSSQDGGAQANEVAGEYEMELGSDSAAEDVFLNEDLYEDPPRLRAEEMSMAEQQSGLPSASVAQGQGQGQAVRDEMPGTFPGLFD